MTNIQIILGKILTSRITREKAAGTLETNKATLIETLDIFLAGDKITAEQYTEFTELITPTATTSSTDSSTSTTTETTTQV